MVSIRLQVFFCALVMASLTGLARGDDASALNHMASVEAKARLQAMF